jgi:hypothetical protein
MLAAGSTLSAIGSLDTVTKRSVCGSKYAKGMAGMRPTVSSLARIV